MARRIHSALRVPFALALGLLAAGGACDCGGDPPGVEKVPCSFNSDCEPTQHCGDDGFCAEGLEPGTCLVDTDCEGESVCVKPDGSDVGACLDPNECDVDADCGEGRVCRDANDDGFRDCVFDGCESDAECVDELTGACDLDVEEPRCIARACACQDLCGQPCGTGTQCCAVPGEQRQCIDEPGPCSTFPCEPGFAGASDAPGAWSAVACDYPDAVCACRELPPLPMGDLGAPQVLAVDAQGEAYVVAYTATYGDVVVAAAAGTPVDGWVFAAGVPAGAPIVAGPSGPRGGVAEPGDDVGRMLDAVFGPDGTLHIVARDETNQALLHLSGPPAGPFQQEVLDDTGDPGFYPTVEIDGQGRLVVAHVARRTSAGTSEVRLLAQPSAGAAPASWHRTTLSSFDLSGVACEGGCAAGEVCPASAVLDVPTCVAEGTGCASCAAGQVCVGSSCVPEAEAADLEDALALDHLASALGPQGLAIFGHEGRQVGALQGFRVASGDVFAGDATFTGARILDDASSDLGNHPSAAATGAGFLVASTDLTAHDVTLLRLGPTLAIQGQQAIDDGHRPHVSGATSDHFVDLPALDVRADGSGVVAWQDGTDGSVRARALNADGSLGEAQVLAGGEAASTYEGNYGFSVGAAALPTSALVSAKRALLDTEPATFEVVVLTGP